MGCGKSRHDRDHESCVCQVVRAIKDLQDNVVSPQECQPCTSCFNEPLGNLVSPARETVDTRVFVLKTKDGSPFHAFFNEDDNACVSIYFRVEDVFDNCCATLRVLQPGRRDGDKFCPVNLVNADNKCCIDLTKHCQVNAFMATPDCVTVDLNCFCAIQCIADVNLGICN